MLRYYIETERLIMRDILPTDAEGMFELDSDAEVHRYLGGRPVKSLDECLRVIDIIRAQYVSNGIGRWAVVEKDTGNFIGWSGLKLITEPINGRSGHYDLGYRFCKRFWGKGYATETAIATVKYAWEELKLKELCGIADLNNTASRRVLEKVGMQFIGEFDYDGARHGWYELKKGT